MPYTSSITQQISKFTYRLNTSDNNELPEGDKIKVCGEFQRGDDETGVWGNSMKRDLISSVLNGFPIGTIMLVKPCGADHLTNHFILDGGNRARAIRDFINGDFTLPCKDKDGSKTMKKFNDLSSEIRQKFLNTNLHLLEIRVLREDPLDTIAQMFTNLNTKILPLTDGELIKAHGWQANIPIIEFAKNLIGEPWVTKLEEDEIIDDVRENWYQTFPGGGPDGTKRETKRCDNIKGMCGYILSSVYSNSGLFDKRFAKIKNYLTPENVITDEQKDKFINDISLFISTINAIENSDKYFKRKCSMQSK